MRAKAPTRAKIGGERWANERLALAQEATSTAIREHLDAGRPVVFEKGGTLFVKTSKRVKAISAAASSPSDPVTAADTGFAECGAPQYITPQSAKKRRAKPR